MMALIPSRYLMSLQIRLPYCVEMMIIILQRIHPDNREESVIMKLKGFAVLSFLVVASFSISFASSSVNAHPTNSYTLAQAETPSARYLPGFVFDPINQRTMMFGGGHGNTEYGDSWVFDYINGTWTELVLSTTPSPRHSCVMVYDSAHEVIILFGGYNGTSPSSETWVFDCASEVWTEMTPELSPPDRMSHAMVYDSVNDRVLLFSGYGPNGPEVDDTWAYDYTTNTWEAMSPITAPHERYGAACVYDEVNESMVIYGGNDNGHFSDTWSYHYSTDTWTDLSPTSHPLRLKWSVMTYDSVNQKSILFGGDIAYPSISNETWVYDSATNEWVEQEPSNAPAAREAFGFTYDSVHEKAILFGGTEGDDVNLFNDTWTYDYATDAWTKITGIMAEVPGQLDPLLIFSVVAFGVTVLVIVYVSYNKRLVVK